MAGIWARAASFMLKNPPNPAAAWMRFSMAAALNASIAPMLMPRRIFF